MRMRGNISCLSPRPRCSAVTSASEYAHRGLDKLEENLPILQQPPEKVTDRRQWGEVRGGGGMLS